MLNQRLFVLGTVGWVFGCAAMADSPADVDLTRYQCLLRVLEYNENVQLKELEWRISRQKVKAEGGIFEPEFVGSYQHQRNYTQTTAEQEVSLQTSILNEHNNIYNAGIDYLLPTGGKMHIGYNVQDLKNNLELQYGITRQYQTFTGVSLSQPLLKGGGVAATSAAIRLAAGESDLAYQDYRRQMMTILVQAEAAYWDLYYFQELTRILEESVSTARTLLNDNQVRLQAGKSSQLEVMEAESGLALREARKNDARHRQVEAMNKLMSFFSGADEFNHPKIRAADHPELRTEPVEYSSSMWAALQNNPDYLDRQRQIMQANIRVAYARNQLLPELDLTASYGLNGLGKTLDASSSNVESGHFETWSVGAELRLPLGGGVKAKHELSAAQMRKQQALLGLKSIEVAISTAMDTNVRRIAGLRESVGDFQRAADFSRRLLDEELSRLGVGKTDSQKVLQTEEKLFEAKRAVQEALVDYQKAFLEWELGKGTILKDRNLDFSRSELKNRTLNSLAALNLPPGQAEHLVSEAKTSYDQRPAKSGSLNTPWPDQTTPTPAPAWPASVSTGPNP